MKEEVNQSSFPENIVGHAMLLLRRQNPMNSPPGSIVHQQSDFVAQVNNIAPTYLGELSLPEEFRSLLPLDTIIAAPQCGSVRPVGLRRYPRIFRVADARR